MIGLLNVYRLNWQERKINDFFFGSQNVSSFLFQTLGHRVRYLFANPRGPRRARPLHPVRLEAHRERSVRRQDQGVGPASCLRHPGADEHALPQDTGGEFFF